MPGAKKMVDRIRQYLLLSFLFLSILNGSAQSNIHGNVVDSKGKPLPNANVLLLNARDSGLIKGIIANNVGSYSFVSHSPGKIMISISFTGYKQIYISPFALSDKKDIDLGTTALAPSDKELGAITIMVKKPLFEQKIDRMVINVKNSITSAGSTALDILERSPGVLVDRQNLSISMGGKDG